MSEFHLDVGACVNERRKRTCISHLVEFGFINEAADLGFEHHQPIKIYSLLNLATVTAFTDYVADLVGRPTSDLMNDDDFANLPYWQDSIWASLDFAPARPFEDDLDGPFFFGSSPRLFSHFELH
jgi:hypothetical protein